MVPHHDALFPGALFPVLSRLTNLTELQLGRFSQRCNYYYLNEHSFGHLPLTPELVLRMPQLCVLSTHIEPASASHLPKLRRYTHVGTWHDLDSAVRPVLKGVQTFEHIKPEKGLFRCTGMDAVAMYSTSSFAWIGQTFGKALPHHQRPRHAAAAAQA